MSTSYAMPRLVVAGTSSGAGKTTTTVALIEALRGRGLKVATFKCGPDYLDPRYLSLASGKSCQNLDGWMMGKDAVRKTFESATRGSDIAVIEGVMGFFDGVSATADQGSTAEISKWLDAPVLLVLDASGMARSVAAMIKGYSEFDPEAPVAGAICNRVGSEGHLKLLKSAAVDVPIVGGLPKQPPEMAFPERHLGLHSPAGKDRERFAKWGEIASEWFDMDQILKLARSAPELERGEAQSEVSPTKKRCRIGIAQDEAFHFYYEDNLRRLRAEGAQLVPFSPIRDSELPDVDGVYIGGGYPELNAAGLGTNTAMHESIRSFAEAGGPVYAECGGLMYLCNQIRLLDGTTEPMVGLISATAVIKDKLQALGYVEVETQSNSLLGDDGVRFRGHQFRYSELVDVDESIERLYSVRRRRGNTVSIEGYRVGQVVASYVHGHWASNPMVPRSLIEACCAFGQRKR